MYGLQTWEGHRFSHPTLWETQFIKTKSIYSFKMLLHLQAWHKVPNDSCVNTQAISEDADLCSTAQHFFAWKCGNSMFSAITRALSLVMFGLLEDTVASRKEMYYTTVSSGSSPSCTVAPLHPILPPTLTLGKDYIRSVTLHNMRYLCQSAIAKLALFVLAPSGHILVFSGLFPNEMSCKKS